MKCNPYQLCFSLAGFAALVTTPQPSVAATLQYSITDLGSLNPNASGFGAYSTAYDINNSGQVVGNSRTPSDSSHAFRTAPNSAMNPAEDDLGTLGGDYSYAYAVNDAGQVVGESSQTAGAYDPRAFLWDRTSGMQDLGTLGGSFSTASGLNNVGQVVGTAETSINTLNQPSNDLHAFLWDRTSGMQDLGTLGGSFSSASDVNDLGQVVGFSSIDDTSGDYHAFRYSNNSLQDLGTLGGDESLAFGVNNAGQVVGTAQTGATYEPDDPKSESGIVSHAFLYSDGKMTDLGTLGGPNSTAYDTNDSGQVVGVADSSDTSDLPFLYSDEEMTDLNDLIPKNSKWYLSDARGINDAGQIIGTGTIQDPERSYPTHAFLLTPVPEPASVLGTLAFGTFGVNRMLKRKRK